MKVKATIAERLRSWPWPWIAQTVAFLSVYFWVFSDTARWQWFIGPLDVDFIFLDLHCLLATFEGHLQGIDVMSGINPIDIGGRGHAYSPIWLEAAGLNLRLKHTGEIGFILFLLFAATVASVFRARTWTQAFVYFTMSISPPVMLGVERGQVDVLMFIMLCLPFILPERLFKTKTALLWISCYLAALLKYFPIVAFSLFATKLKKKSSFFFAAAMATIGVGLFIGIYWFDLTRSIDIFARPYSLWSFGRELMFTVFFDDAKSVFIFRGLLLLIIVGSCYLALKKTFLECCPVNSNKEALFLVGASVYVFSFIATTNFDYRFLFLFPTLPYLFWMVHLPGWTWIARYIISMTLLLTWAEMTHYYAITWFYGEWQIRWIKSLVFYKGALSWIVFAHHFFLIIAILRNQLGYKYGFFPVSSFRNRLNRGP